MNKININIISIWLLHDFMLKSILLYSDSEAAGKKWGNVWNNTYYILLYIMYYYLYYRHLFQFISSLRFIEFIIIVERCTIMLFIFNKKAIDTWYNVPCHYIITNVNAIEWFLTIEKQKMCWLLFWCVNLLERWMKCFSIAEFLASIMTPIRNSGFLMNDAFI